MSVKPTTLLASPLFSIPAAGDMLEVDLQEIEMVVGGRGVHTGLDETVAELVQVEHVMSNPRRCEQAQRRSQLLVRLVDHRC